MVDIWYAVILVICLCFTVSVNIFLQNKVKIHRAERAENRAYISKLMAKIIMSKNEILQTNNIFQELKKISSVFSRNKFLNSRIVDYSVVWVLFLRIATDGSKLFLIMIFIFWFMEGKIGFWEFVSILSILYIMEQILQKFSDIYVTFSKSIVDVHLLWNFFDTTPEIQWYETWAEFIHDAGEIQISDLSFWYAENSPVFSDFNLHIPGWKITAFVWNSGSGKSTLVKLIAWYIRPQSGDIIIDDQKLSDVSLKSYYKDIGYLTQEPSVFDGTILENLTYALESPQPPLLKGEQEEEAGKDQEIGQPQGLSLRDNTQSTHRRGTPCGYPNDENEFEKHLHDIIKLAKCEFIYDFPNGLHTEIGEKWIRLSGWQRQRLAIAKIFLKDPKIIILDEPTSALDSFSEEQITQAMHNLFKDRTVIVIAHRLQTVKHADKILVLENGRIVEEWTHTTLTRKKWIYKRMLDLQSGF